MLVLNYPRKQSVAFSDTLLKLYELATKTTEQEIYFNLSKTFSLSPLGIILLTATIYECHRRGKKCKYKNPEDEDLNGFLTRVGFHKHFGLDDVSTPRIDAIQDGAVQLRKTRGLDSMLIETLIEILDFHLKISPGVKGFLQMSLIETMTNVVDHSGVQDYFVCCWNYPEKKQIRLCIADLGIGIRASLRKSEQYRSLTNHYEAIILSTEAGVSSRPERAGMGLSSIKKFLHVNKGQMCIISGKGKAFWKFDQGKILKQTISQFFNGTIVKLVINTDKEWRYFLSNEKEYLI